MNYIFWPEPCKNLNLPLFTQWCGVSMSGGRYLVQSYPWFWHVVCTRWRIKKGSTVSRSTGDETRKYRGVWAKYPIGRQYLAVSEAQDFTNHGCFSQVDSLIGEEDQQWQRVLLSTLFRRCARKKRWSWWRACYASVPSLWIEDYYRASFQPYPLHLLWYDDWSYQMVYTLVLLYITLTVLRGVVGTVLPSWVQRLDMGFDLSTFEPVSHL